MTSLQMNPRQPSVPRGTTVCRMFSHSPAPGPPGRAAKPRRLPLSPFFFPGNGRDTLDIRTSIMLCGTMVSRFSQKSRVFRLFRLFVNKKRTADAIRFFRFPYSAGFTLSTVRIVPFSRPNVVVLTTWVKPARISWVPNLLLGLS